MPFNISPRNIDHKAGVGNTYILKIFLKEIDFRVVLIYYFLKLLIGKFLNDILVVGFDIFDVAPDGFLHIFNLATFLIHIPFYILLISD